MSDEGTETQARYSPEITEKKQHDIVERAHGRKIRWIESARLGLTVLNLLVGITIVSTTADVLAVYNKTSSPSEFYLALWPASFNLGPNIAIAVGGAVVVLTCVVALLTARVALLRNMGPLHTVSSLVAPSVGLIGAIVGIAFYYAINASDSVDQLQSWSCRWKDVSMNSDPKFGTLCSETQTALYLSIILIPLELIAAGLGAGAFMMEKKMANGSVGTSSPALS